MTEEIKKTLEDVKRHLDYLEATKQCSIRDNEMKVMYNYITNLQKENEYLKLNNPEMNIEHFKIIKENKRKIDILRKQNKDYKQRNEKAIEYIKAYYLLNDNEFNMKNVLNILQGGDK